MEKVKRNKLKQNNEQNRGGDIILDDISGLSAAIQSITASMQIIASDPLKVITPGTSASLCSTCFSADTRRSCIRLLVLCSAF